MASDKPEGSQQAEKAKPQLGHEMAEMVENIQRAEAKAEKNLETSYQGLRVEGQGSSPGRLVMLGETLEDHMAVASNQAALGHPRSGELSAVERAPSGDKSQTQSLSHLLPFAGVTSAALGLGAIGVSGALSAFSPALGLVGGVVGAIVGSIFGSAVGSLGRSELGKSALGQPKKAQPDERGENVRQQERQMQEQWRLAQSGQVSEGSPFLSSDLERKMADISNQATLEAMQRRQGS